MGFPGGSVVKNPPASARDTVLIPESGRSPAGRNGNPLQYSCRDDPMDKGAWWATVHVKGFKMGESQRGTIAGIQEK